MPPRRLSFREVSRKLTAAGFVRIGQRGSHVKFGKHTPQGFVTTTVPRHNVIAVDTLRSIIRQAGLSWREFEEL